MRGNPTRMPTPGSSRSCPTALRRVARSHPEGKLTQADAPWSAFHRRPLRCSIGLQESDMAEWATMRSALTWLFNLIMAGIMRETSRG